MVYHAAGSRQFRADGLTRSSDCARAVGAMHAIAMTIVIANLIRQDIGR
jgi:hypothetical protein